jgi:beta-lactamase regulating signal transducer with metallopeptidase domain
MAKAIVINSDRIYPLLLEKLHTSLFVNELSLGLTLIIIWALGSAISFLKDVFQFIMEIQEIRSFIFVDDEQVNRISKEKDFENVEIFVSPNITVPKVTGILKPYIYLPLINVSDDELRLILKHEIRHIHGGDIIIKLFYNIIKDIFWWNPITCLFQYEVDNLLELRCDRAVTKNMNYQERINYLNTILQVIKQLVQTTEKVGFSKSIMNFISFRSVDITKQRFQAIMENEKSWKSAIQVITSSVIIILFILSFFFIIQPAYYPDFSKNEEMIEITNENSYIEVFNEAGILYINGEFYGYLSDDELNTLPYSELTTIWGN